MHGLPWFAVCGDCEYARWQADGHPRRLWWDGALLLALTRDWYVGGPAALAVAQAAGGRSTSVRVLEP